MLNKADVNSGSNLIDINDGANTFVSGDIGKTLVVEGPNGNANFITTIASINSTSEAVMGGNCPFNGYGTSAAWYTSSQDDTTALTDAMSAVVPGTGVLYAPGDLYIISAPITCAQNLTALIGDGVSNTMFLYTGTGSFLTVGQGGIWGGPTQPANINPMLGLVFGGSPSDGFSVLVFRSHAPARITSYSVTANVVTFNSSFGDFDYIAGDLVMPQGFTNATVVGGTPIGFQLRDNVYTVRAGASSTSFTALVVGAVANTGATLSDTGLCTRSWNGLNFLYNGGDWVSVQNVEIHAFDGDGMLWCNTIVTDLTKVIIWNCSGNGFNGIHGSPFDVGTSTTFTATWAKSCGKAGYYIDFSFYFCYNATASDQNGVNYFFQNCEQMTMNSCGSESPIASNSAAYPGYGYLFDTSAGMVLNSCYFFEQDFSTARGDSFTNTALASQTGFVFRHNCNQFIMNIPNFENAVHYTPPTYLFDIDNTCTDAMVAYPRFGTLGTSAFTMPNTNSNNTTLMRDASFSTDWKFNAAMHCASTAVCNAGLTVNGGTIHCSYLTPDQGAILFTTANIGALDPKVGWRGEHHLRIWCSSNVQFQHLGWYQPECEPDDCHRHEHLGIQRKSKPHFQPTWHSHHGNMEFDRD